jgi:hypothetical protein
VLKGSKVSLEPLALPENVVPLVFKDRKGYLVPPELVQQEPLDRLVLRDRQEVPLEPPVIQEHRAYKELQEPLEPPVLE